MHIDITHDAGVTDVIIAGWAGRHKEDVEHHIQELALLGVAPPSTTPLFYQVSVDRLTQDHNIAVVGDNTSGEAEPVLLATRDGLFVGIGSDHTDRTCENFSVALSKQVCPKVVGQQFWRYEDVQPYWDDLYLRSYLHDGDTRILYQNGQLSSLLRPEVLMQQCPRQIASGLLENGTVMFCGTTVAIGGIVPTPKLTVELFDPVKEKTLSHTYTVACLPVVA